MNWFAKFPISLQGAFFECVCPVTLFFNHKVKSFLCLYDDDEGDEDRDDDDDEYV